MAWISTQPLHRWNKKYPIHGVTLIEVMMGVILMAMLLGSLWYIFMGGSRGVREAVANHEINEEAQKIVDFVTNDLREANFISTTQPPIVAANATGSLQTQDPNNKICFTKVYFDFTKDPNTFAQGQVNYTGEQIIYLLDKDPPKLATQPWILYRDVIPVDDRRQVQTGQKKRKQIAEHVPKLVFYRLLPTPGDDRGAGPGNVYITF